MKDNYLYRALGFAAPEYQAVLDTGAPALDGLKARQPIDAATGRSFAAVQTDLLLARPWRDSQQQTLAWIPVTTKSRSIDLFEPRYLAYYPVKYVKTGDRVNIHLVLRYQVQDNLTFSQCPLPGETVVVLHVKKISADE